MIELSEIQKKKFKEISGVEFIFKDRENGFLTRYPYNNREWKYSSWEFNYVIEEGTNNLICELYHRMTNNRIYGWDKDGNELDEEILYKYFTPDL